MSRAVAIVHGAIAVFFAVYLWAMGYGPSTWLYAGLALSYAAYCNKLHPLDTLLIFLAVVAMHVCTGCFREGFQDGKKSKKKQDADDEADDDEQEEDPDGGSKEKFDDAKDAHMDLGSTFLTAYKKLNPDQVSAMRDDTKELMETQRELMETLSTMGPAVQQGMDMIDSFKKYFGSGNLSTLAPPQG